MNLKVMVVDDSLMIRRQVGKSLREANFDVIEAKDGLDAFEQLSTDQQDTALIILDVNMPKMGGIELLEHLRAQAPELDIPVIMLTTEGQPEFVSRAKKLGAKGWIIKPFKANLLVAAARKLTQSATV